MEELGAAEPGGSQPGQRSRQSEAEGALGDCWPMISGANEWVCEVINYLHLSTHFRSFCGCIIKDMGLYRDYGGTYNAARC